VPSNSVHTPPGANKPAFVVEADFNEGSRLRPSPSLSYKGQNYYFLASFLSEEEAARFTENFAFRKPTAPWLRPFEAGDERGFVPWGQVVPKDVGDRLTARLAADEDLEDASIASMIERDRQDSEGDYVFTLPEEIKARWLERKQQQEKKKV